MSDSKGTKPNAHIRFARGLNMTASDRTIAEGFVRMAEGYATRLNPKRVAQKCKAAPEMFAWIDFRYLNCLNIAYMLTQDSKYLDHFRNAFSIYRNTMSTGPDKYLGWYGKPVKARAQKDKPELQIDEIQMTFRAISILSLWVELSRRDPAYARANQASINAYLELMEKHLFPKWDARGYYVKIKGRGGVYRGLDFPMPQSDAGTTLSHEKLSIIVDGLLKLYRVTDHARYAKRALELGAWFKSNLSVKDGHYEWMSCVPAGVWDKHPSKPDSWKQRWFAPDPNGEWYVASLSIALNLYQHGLLFADVDIKRFVKTQKVMCWNGDMGNPVYRTVAGDSTKWVKGRFLSHQLAHYDPVIAKLAFDGPHEAFRLRMADNSWSGCANAQDYVLEKYVNRPIVAVSRKPFEAFGKKFLARKENRAFYEELFFEVEGKGAKAPPAKPSLMFRKDK